MLLWEVGADRSDYLCAEPMDCVDCGGQRSSIPQNYPFFKQEMAIKELRTLNELSCVKVCRDFIESTIIYKRKRREENENTE